MDTILNIKVGDYFFYNSQLWTKIDESGWNGKKQLSSGEWTYVQLEDDTIVDVVVE